MCESILVVGAGDAMKRDHASLYHMGKAKSDHEPQPRLAQVAFLEVFAVQGKSRYRLL